MTTKRGDIKFYQSFGGQLKVFLNISRVYINKLFRSRIISGAGEIIKDNRLRKI